MGTETSHQSMFHSQPTTTNHHKYATHQYHSYQDPQQQQHQQQRYHTPQSTNQYVSLQQHQQTKAQYSYKALNRLSTNLGDAKNLSMSNAHLNSSASLPYTQKQNQTTSTYHPQPPTYTQANSSINGPTVTMREDDSKIRLNKKKRPVSEGNFFTDFTIYEDEANKASLNTNQQLFVLRHGERVDTTFGPLWTENSFDKNGRYIRFNINMPKTLPKRENPKYDFLFDPPLTEMGLHQAKLTGEELASQGIVIKYCYSSPALRSIQTADRVLEGMGLKNKVQIRIELGLFEFLRWQTSLPVKYPFMDLQSLANEGYNIDLNYTPVIKYDMMRYDENEEYYYQRSFLMTKTIVDRHREEGGNIMFVAHAPSIEVCTRQLCGGDPRVSEFRSIVRKVPFLAIAQCERNPHTSQWKLKKPPIPALKHLGVDAFDWKNLKSTNNPNNIIKEDQYVHVSLPHYSLLQPSNVMKPMYVPWRI